MVLDSRKISSTCSSVLPVVSGKKMNIVGTIVQPTTAKTMKYRQPIFSKAIGVAIPMTNWNKYWVPVEMAVIGARRWRGLISAQ